MELPAPPFLPSPRYVPADLARPSVTRRSSRSAALAFHLAGVLLYLAIPTLLIFGGVWLLQEESLHRAWRLLGFTVFVPLGLIALKSLLPRRVPITSARVAISPDDEPTAYAFLVQVASDLKGKGPRKLLVASGTELRLTGSRSPLDLIRPGRSDLLVGLWLWNGLTLSEFQALLIRTLAPLSHGTRERWRLALREWLDALLLGTDFIDQHAESGRPLSGLARFVGRAHSMVTYPARFAGRVLYRLGDRPEDVLADDLAAVRLCGSDAIVHGILRADFVCATLDQADRFLAKAVRTGLKSSDIYAHSVSAATALWEAHNDFTLGQPPPLRGPNAGKYADVFEPGARYLSAMWTGMPSPPEREQSAKRVFVACERDERPAATLLTEMTKLREHLSALRYENMVQNADELLSVPPSLVERWIAEQGKLEIPSFYQGCYDDARPIEPGTPSERNAALASDEWDEIRLLYTAARLYENAGDRAGRRLLARKALKKVNRRTLYRPGGRDYAIADEAEEELRKLSHWFAALDRWAYVVHVHMAARLPDLALHEALLARYQCVLKFQTIPNDARDYRDRVAAFVRRTHEQAADVPYRLARDARQEYKASLNDFELLIGEMVGVQDGLLNELIGELPLNQFLYSHTHLPAVVRDDVLESGQRLLAAWDELLAKSRWVHDHNIAELLRLHEEIRKQFTAQVGGLPATVEGAQEVILLEPIDEGEQHAPIDQEPEIIDAEVIEEE